MKNEVKIILPFYKLLYPLISIAFLAVLRGIAHTREIGVTLDPMLAILSCVFMADTYLLEQREQRWEILALYTLHKKRNMICKRILVQALYLFLVGAIGYLFFFIQKPAKDRWNIEMRLYLEFLPGSLVTIVFFGVLALTIANCFRNMWCGIGITLVLWFVTNSTVGNNTFGKFNVFAYVFRAFGNDTDYYWLLGKGVALICTMLMLLVLPNTIKGRK